MRETPPTEIRLDSFSQGEFTRGRSLVVEALWMLVGGLLVSSGQPVGSLRRWSLRLFGAEIGKGAVIKPHVKIKFPWRLRIGDHSWIGEYVWIDNLAPVDIGDHSCISQAAYLCTGSHDWNSPQFNLQTAPITIGKQCWICARAVVAPGVSIGDGAIVSLGAVATKNVPAWHIASSGKQSLRPRSPLGQQSSPYSENFPRP